MEVVKHVLGADGPVGVEKFVAHVQEQSLAQPWQPGAQEPVDCGILLPQRVGLLSAG